MKTSKNSLQTPFLFPTFGPEDSHVRTSRWLEWARERDLKGSDLDSFTSLLVSWEKHAPELFYSKTLQVSLAPIEEQILPPSSGRWPVSGILSAGVCSTAKTSESPNHAKESTLSGVIETSKVPDKYFLKASAAEGMLRRANRMGRPLFPPLRQSLEKMVEMDRSSSQSPTASTPVQPATRERTGAELTSSIPKRAKSVGSRRENAKA